MALNAINDVGFGFACFPLLFALAALRRVQHIPTLHTQEKPIILAEECLLHDAIDLNHLEYVGNVEIATQLLDALIQVEVMLRVLAALKTALLSAHEATQVVP